MTVKLTDRFLTSRKAPPTGRVIYTDATVPGLTFRVSARRRDWLLRYRPRGQAQRAAALGTYPAVSLSQARQRAGEIVVAAKRGVDLIAVEEREAEGRRMAEAKIRPLSEIAGAYLDSIKRLRSWRSIESRTRCHIIPNLGNKPIGQVTRADWSNFSMTWSARRGCGIKSTDAGKRCGPSLPTPSNVSSSLSIRLSGCRSARSKFPATAH
jgi:hypothetical protein